MNLDVLTREENQMPMGMGAVAAAEHLGLIYLESPEVVLNLLSEYANRAWRFAMRCNLPAESAWQILNGMSDELAAIFRGEHSAYLATFWFIDSSQLMAALYSQFLNSRPNDPPGALWRTDPLKAKSREFISFFIDLAEGANIGFNCEIFSASRVRIGRQ
jgi:hypothetical protein